LRGALDEHVAERALARGLGSQHVAREAAVARTRFDDEERVGFVERVPQAVDRPSDTFPEQRTDFGAGQEVTPGPPGTAARREEAALAVEGGFDEAVERDRSLAVDPLPDVQKESSPTLAKSCG
jgi:hypothetical protein